MADEDDIEVIVSDKGFLGVRSSETNGEILVCAIVDRVPTVDAWGVVFYEAMISGVERPLYVAATVAVKMWGGKVLLLRDDQIAEA